MGPQRAVDHRRVGFYLCNHLHHVGAQIEARSRRRGVIRSSLQPEETAGLTRSGDLSRMLPFEAHLLAAGWPRSDGPDGVPPLSCLPLPCEVSAAVCCVLSVAVSSALCL